MASEANKVEQADRLLATITKKLEQRAQETTRGGWRIMTNELADLHDRLVEWLHEEKNPTPNWIAFPVARDWFLQTNP